MQASLQLQHEGSRVRHAHGDLTSLAPHERLPEILVVPREKTPTPASRALCQAKRAPRAAFPSGCLAAQTKRWAEGIRVPGQLPAFQGHIGLHRWH